MQNWPQWHREPSGAQSQRVVFSSFKIMQSYPPILAPKSTECVGIYKNVAYRKY